MHMWYGGGEVLPAREFVEWRLVVGKLLGLLKVSMVGNVEGGQKLQRD